VSLLAALLLFSALSLAFTQNEPERLLQDANSAFRSGDRDRARLLFETLTALYPQSPEAAEGWFRLGQIESEDLFLDEALCCFTQVVNIPPPHLASKLSLTFSWVWWASRSCSTEQNPPAKPFQRG
jgi:tetratricopeptide (TPR) repeat protein